MNRKNGNQIDEEPILEIVTGNGSTIINQLFQIVMVGSQKAEYNINEENEVYDAFHDHPLRWRLVVERHMVRRKHTRDHTGSTIYAFIQQQ